MRFGGPELQNSFATWSRAVVVYDTQWKFGPCVRGSRLILSLGAVCKPFFDKSDIMRSLVCRGTPSRTPYIS